eukprot:scaffold2799_cov159-Ochromonas_danica.AAC.17
MNSKKKFGVSKHGKKKLTKGLKVTLQEPVESKDILQLFKEKFTDDASSAFYQAELLYIVNLYRRKTGGNEASSALTGSTTAVAERLINSRQGRYLIIIRTVNPANQITMIKLYKKDSDLEVKQTYEMPSIKSVDYGSEDNELVLSLESMDISLHLFDLIERDQTLWVITEVYKAVTGGALSTGYSVDLDSVAYGITTSGTLTKFPALQKFIKIDSSQMGDRFSADEAEAEQILERLQWSKSLSEPMDIHQILSTTSEKLNNEIIDFLLQWEQMDSLAVSSSASASSSSLAASAKGFGLKDTTEVLKALTDVDCQLDVVDSWLGEQIDHLSAIQANLSMIESESGALETSWQNLNVVQDVVSLLVTKYSITTEQENLLRNPDRIMSALGKVSSLSLIEKTLQPLVDAALVLRDAVNLKTNDLCSLTNAQWKQIQGMAAISAQKARLTDISTTFCENLAGWAANLFDWLLKNKALTEGEGKTSGLIPKQFISTRNAVEEICYQKVDNFISSPTISNKFRLPRRKYRQSDKNQLIESQVAYHTQVEKFSVLLDLLVELCPELSKTICDAYMQATCDRLYYSLVKAYVKDMQTLITCKQSPISMTTCSRFRSDSARSPLVRFGAVAGKPLPSWRAFEVALLLLCPLIDHEEAFIKKTFHLDGRRPEGTSQTALTDRADVVNLVADATTFAHSRLHRLLLGLFESVPTRLLSLSNTSPSSNSGSGGEMDGIEAVAMLTVLTDFIAFYQENKGSVDLTDGSSSKEVNGDIGVAYFYTSLLFEDMKATLQQRIQTFTNEQINWIRAQKGDPKAPGVFTPFARFPTVVLHIMEMVQGQVHDSMVRYLHWMVEYEFPSLSALASRIEGVSNKVSDEELSLYIRRKDVLNVVKELEARTIDNMVSNLRKRVEKHFRSEFDSDLRLVDKLWLQLKERVVGILSKLEAAALASYQISLEVGPGKVAQAFDKQQASST